MKLKEYVAGLNKFLAENEGLAEAIVIYASDDEGNDHCDVNYEPSIMFRSDHDNEMLHEEDIEQQHCEDYHQVVCVN